MSEAEFDITYGRHLKAGVRYRGHVSIECVDKDGKQKWTRQVGNIVVNQGLDANLDAFWGSGKFVGLIDGATPTLAATDSFNPASKAWTENTNYSEPTRPAYTPGSASGQSLNNSVSKASFSINANSQTIGGAFIATVGTKDNGTTGVLVNEATFSAAAGVNNGDTLNVTYTITAADDGV